MEEEEEERRKVVRQFEMNLQCCTAVVKVINLNTIIV
jgi:hypothetical protein